MFLLLFSHSVVSTSLQPHGLQHARLPCPSPSPGACSNSCPLSQWCHPTILSSVIPFSSCPQSFLAPRSFPMYQLFASGDQSIEVSASASVLSVNIQIDFLLDWQVWSPCSPRDSQESFPTPQSKSINSLALRWQDENHNHRKLTKLITWITALSNSIKPWAMPCRATQDGQVIVESSDKAWSLAKGMGNQFFYIQVTSLITRGTARQGLKT